MRAAASFFVIGGAVAALGAGGLATAAQSARLKPVAAPVRVASTVETPLARTQAEIDAERRARLGTRMQHMVREGRGGRLADPVARPVVRAATPAARPSRTASPAPVAEVVTDRPESSTIRPPAHDPARAAWRPAGGRYVAPRLDLKTPPVVPTDPIECLTQAIYYEARNESEEGQMAVAEVVLNRSRHGAYPRDICQVVYQRNSRTCQFTFTCDGSIGRRPVNRVAWARAERLAREAHGGGGRGLLPANSVNYHANYVRPSWGARLDRVRQIGAHVFYGAPRSGARNPGAGEATPAERAPRGLMFVRNEALDRAYAAFKGGGDAS